MLSSSLLLRLVTSKKSLTCSVGVALKKDHQESENWMKPIPDESNCNPLPECPAKGMRMLLH